MSTEPPVVLNMKSSDTLFEEFLVPESDESLIGGHFLNFYVKKDLIWLLLSPYTESFALETPQKVRPMYVNTNAVSIIYAFYARVSAVPEKTAGKSESRTILYV